MTKKSDFPVYATMGLLVPLVIFKFVYGFPERIFLTVPSWYEGIAERLTVIPAPRAHLTVEMWLLLVAFIVSTFGTLYLFASLKGKTQQFSLVQTSTTLLVGITFGVLAWLVSAKVLLFYSELVFLSGVCVCCVYLLTRKRYEEEYMQCFLNYILIVFFTTLGTSAHLFPGILSIVLFAFIATTIYAFLFWVFSMTLIFLREFATF